MKSDVDGVGEGNRAKICSSLENFVGGKAMVVVLGKATGTARAPTMVMAKGTAIIHNLNKMFDNTLKSS